MPSLTPSRIVLRHSNVSGEKPGTDDLLLGEVYINIPDNKLYYKNNDDLVNPIVEVELTTSNELIHVRDVNLTEDGNLIATYSDNNTKPLGSVLGPRGRGLAIDGVVDYVTELPTSSTIANILNKNGTLFIVRLGEDNETPFDPTGPRIYSYSTSGGGTWSELEDATVAANGEDGVDGNTIISGVDEIPLVGVGVDGDYYLDRINYVIFGPKSAGVWPTPGVSLKAPNSLTSSTTSNGTAVLDISSVETDDITITDSITFNNTEFNYGTGAAAAHKNALGLVDEVVQYRLDTPPSQLEPEDAGVVMLLQYGDSVWFKDNNDTTYLLVGSGNEQNQYILSETLISDNTFTVTSSPVTVSPGTYNVDIAVSNYIAGSYNINYFTLKYDSPGDAIFDSNSVNPDTLLDMYTSVGDAFLEFFLQDPALVTSQSGSVTVTVNAETQFYIYGDFNYTGDSADFLITFTQV